ncbi:MAG: polyprenyl synthetase family protein [Pseudomonadota bacterium]|nr:polyprenyl synthetase family protein [Pseudomonadota bacterium]
MSFVTGLSLPNSVNKDVQPIDLVDDFIQGVYKSQSAKKLDDILMDYHLTTNKKLRAKICLDVAKNLGIRSKDVLGWACGCEIFNNAYRVSEISLQKILNSDFNSTAEDLKSIYESQIATSSFLALIPLSLGQIPINDGIKNRLLITVMDFSLKVHEAQLGLLNLDYRGSSVNRSANLPGRLISEYQEIVSRKAQALFEMPVYGTALIVGLSDKEAKRISESFRDLGILVQMVEDIIAFYGNKEDMESSLSFLNLLLVSYVSTFPNLSDSIFQKVQKILNGESDREELAKEFLEKQILRDVLTIVRSQIMNIEKSESLKPWPKIVELVKIYSQNLTRPIDHLLRNY